MEDFPAHLVEIAHRGELGIARPVGPEGQQAAILPGKAEQDGEHSRRQLDRDLFDPIEGFAVGQAVEHLAGALADLVLHRGHRAGGEFRRHGAALAGVFGAIHRDEHRQLAPIDAALGQFLLAQAVEDGDPAIFPARRERLGQRLDMLDRLVADHRPIGAEGAFGDVVQRPRLAHFAEDRMPGVFGVDVAAADIPFVRMMRAMLGMLVEMRFERFVGARFAADLRPLNGGGGHGLSPSAATPERSRI